MVKIFRENKWNKFGTEDPYYQEYEIEQRSFLTGSTSMKKVKKPRAVPEGISTNDSDILKKIMRRAYQLDMNFSVVGYRFGWNNVVSFVPFVGSACSVVLSLMLFKLALDLDGGLPWEVQAEFIGNIIIDFAISFIPFVGSLIEVMYKANSRNALLLEKHLYTKGQTLKLH
ncbi:hypothetical protein WICPIJ_008343 [Wickerhamomyces pijperi]|uniref:DUF4112 domain-containing protein n=1 Tax=Wickerhamomyces pijperi TaxID=599730 RepID=A0A9P8TIW3_WICPI|nr:hypothetical protein WICPIJ_008343 [Wickerhamomyces pijperi]